MEIAVIFIELDFITRKQAQLGKIEIENVVRKSLNLELIKTYRGEDLRDVIYDLLSKTKLVDSTWESVARLIPNKELSAILKRQIINKWIDIRARSYVKTYVQLVKRNIAKKKIDDKEKIKLSKKTEPAMRKKLT